MEVPEITEQNGASRKSREQKADRISDKGVSRSDRPAGHRDTRPFREESGQYESADQKKRDTILRRRPLGTIRIAVKPPDKREGDSGQNHDAG